MQFNPRFLQVLAGTALLLAGCTKGQSIGPSSESAGKSETDDDDKADTSAPVSGAYLTCYVPPPKDTDEYIVGGCQARDKNKARLDLSKNNNVKWGFLPPAGNKTQAAMAVYDMSHAKTQRYFDAVFQLKIPPKSASGLTQGASRRDLGLYFLNSVPVLSTRLTLLSEARKKGQKPSTPVNALSLTEVQNTFRQISARFPNPQSAPQTQSAMLSTSATGQTVTDQTFAPVEVQPLAFSSVDQVTYDQGDQTQDAGQGQYTTISGDPYYDTGSAEGEAGGVEGSTEGGESYDSFAEGEFGGEGGETGGEIGGGETGGTSGGETGGGETGGTTEL